MVESFHVPEVYQRCTRPGREGVHTPLRRLRGIPPGTPLRERFMHGGDPIREAIMHGDEPIIPCHLSMHHSVCD